MTDAIAAPRRARYLGEVGPHRSPARVGRDGTVTVTGLPMAEGEEVDVIVVRTQDDAARYAAMPVTAGEFSDTYEPMARDAGGWDEIE